MTTSFDDNAWAVGAKGRKLMNKRVQHLGELEKYKLNDVVIAYSAERNARIKGRIVGVRDVTQLRPTYIVEEDANKHWRYHIPYGDMIRVEEPVMTTCMASTTAKLSDLSLEAEVKDLQEEITYLKEEISDYQYEARVLRDENSALKAANNELRNRALKERLQELELGPGKMIVTTKPPEPAFENAELGTDIQHGLKVLGATPARYTVPEMPDIKDTPLTERTRSYEAREIGADVWGVYRSSKYAGETSVILAYGPPQYRMSENTAKALAARLNRRGH